MKRMRIPNLVVAATLAVILPLELAHCVFMGFERHGAPASTGPHAMHACCERAAAARSHALPNQFPAGCVCAQLPAGSLPSVLKINLEVPSVASVVMPTVITIGATVSILSETVPALDVGSPPLPADPGAQLSRAPPVSA